MNNIIYSTVIYPCGQFDIFIQDYLMSVFMQTCTKFDLLLVLDNVDVDIVKGYVKVFNNNDVKVHIKEITKKITPIELRKIQVDEAYAKKADILIFSDFDENVALNRVEEVVRHIDDFAFAFNDFYIVDDKLERINDESFFSSRKIPTQLNDYAEILSNNFVGLGSMAINLRKFPFEEMVFPKDIKALDWYIATSVLLSGNKGVALFDTYANYRQHNGSFVGFDFKLDESKLMQGIDVKIAHYNQFKDCSDEFRVLHDRLIELKGYIQINGSEKYIKLVNDGFLTSGFCWWENIKTKEELGL